MKTKKSSCSCSIRCLEVGIDISFIHWFIFFPYILTKRWLYVRKCEKRCNQKGFCHGNLIFLELSFWRILELKKNTFSKKEKQCVSFRNGILVEFFLCECPLFFDRSQSWYHLYSGQIPNEFSLCLSEFGGLLDIGAPNLDIVDLSIPLLIAPILPFTSGTYSYYAINCIGMRINGEAVPGGSPSLWTNPSIPLSTIIDSGTTCSSSPLYEAKLIILISSLISCFLSTHPLKK